MVGIKIPMPNSCNECYLNGYNKDGTMVCHLSGVVVEKPYMVVDKRDKTCPLIDLDDDKK